MSWSKVVGLLKGKYEREGDKAEESLNNASLIGTEHPPNTHPSSANGGMPLVLVLTVLPGTPSSLILFASK